MITVMLPTRGRAALCLESAQSLLGLAECAEEIEIVLRRDIDDTTKYPPIPQSTLLVGQPLGYAGLCRYYDECAAASHGEWLVVWNDDSTMLSTHWDTTLRRLDARTSWIAFAHNLFPAVAKRWFETTGRLSASPHIDTYVEYVAKALVARGLIPAWDDGPRWDILHKCDQLDDEGSERRRREILGPQGTSAKFFESKIQDAILDDANRIADAIRF